MRGGLKTTFFLWSFLMVLLTAASTSFLFYRTALEALDELLEKRLAEQGKLMRSFLDQRTRESRRMFQKKLVARMDIDGDGRISARERRLFERRRPRLAARLEKLDALMGEPSHTLIQHGITGEKGVPRLLKRWASRLLERIAFLQDFSGLHSVSLVMFESPSKPHVLFTVRHEEENYEGNAEYMEHLLAGSLRASEANRGERFLTLHPPDAPALKALLLPLDTHGDHRKLALLLACAPDYMAVVERYKSYMWKLPLMALLPGLLLCWILSSVVTRPLRELMNGMRHISEGGRDAIIPSERSDEIGDVARTFLATIRKLDEQRLKREETLRESAAAMARLAGMVAHEVKNPLAGMRLQLDLAKRRLSRDERREVGACLERVSGEIDELDRFVRNVMRLGSIHSNLQGRFEIREALGSLTHDERVEIIAPDSPIMVRGDREAIARVFVNLAGNAFEAGAGSVVVEIREEESSSEVVVRVGDDGPGIAAEHADEIWRPSFTTKEGGGGLGLFIAKSIVEAHDGSIELARRGGEAGRGGAVFEVRLPLADSGGREESPHDREEEEHDDESAHR